MKTQSANFRQRVEEIFYKAAFVRDLGIRIHSIGEGVCETTLDVQPKHMQQDTFIHAGVQATMADHTAGGAAGSLAAEGETVLTVEFKINFLRPAVGRTLRCKATVLKAGKTLSVAESEVFAVSGTQDHPEEKLVAKATVTLAIVKQ